MTIARPIGLGFGISRSHTQDVRFYLWHGEEIVAQLELDPTLRVHLGASVTVDPGEQETKAMLALPFVRAFLSVNACPVSDPRAHARRVSLELRGDHDGAFPELTLAGKLGSTVARWSSTAPWWSQLEMYVPLVQRLLGSPTREEHEIARRDVTVNLPEGTYRLAVRLYEAVYRLPRWPYPKRFHLAEVRPHAKGPTVPGKGENSWDCGDETMGESTYRARTVEEAAGMYVGRVLELRQRRAGTWTYPTNRAPSPPDAHPTPTEPFDEDELPDTPNTSGTPSTATATTAEEATAPFVEAYDDVVGNRRA